MKERRVAELAASALSSYFLYQILVGKFNYFAKKEIKERDRDTCQGCGVSGRTHQLEASHINHSKKSPDYNNSENGEMLCRPCHYNYHLSHQGRAKEIGLRESENDWAINSIWERMDFTERRDAEYGRQQGF